MAVASSPCPAAELVKQVKPEDGAPALAPPPSLARLAAADAVVAANLLQIEALTRQLAATHACLDTGGSLEELRRADERYAVELEGKLSLCFEGVERAQAVILPQPPPMAVASSPCPAAELVKLEGAGPALVPPPSLPPAPPPSRARLARWAAADAVVAANLLQIEALGPELEATRARLAIEDEGVRREAYGRYAVELEDQRGRCLDRVIDVHAGILPQPPPMAAASSPCPAAELVKQVKPEPVDD
jgi:hypothetical protein